MVTGRLIHPDLKRIIDNLKDMVQLYRIEYGKWDRPTVTRIWRIKNERK